MRPNYALEEKMHKEEEIRRLREFKANPINYHPTTHHRVSIHYSREQ